MDQLNVIVERTPALGCSMPTGRRSAVPAPLAVGADLVPSCGGAWVTVRAFQQALGGSVASFTSPKFAEEMDSEFIHLRADAGPLGRAFRRVPGAELRRLDAELGNVNLLSLHILYRQSSHWVWSRARRRGLPYWVVPHGCLDPYVFTYRATVKKLWLALWGRRIMRGATHVICATNRELEKAVAWFPREKGRVVHWPVDLPDLSRRREARRALRKRLSLPPDARILVYLGRLHPMKRPRETLRWCAQTKPAVTLVVAGPDDGVTAACLRQDAAALNATAAVRVLGSVHGANKTELLLGADGYVSLSWRENFNYAAAEALAAGLPVILSRGNDLAVDVPADCGWRLGADNEAAAVEAIRAFGAASFGVLRDMGATGREFARQRLSFTAFQSTLRDLLAEAVGTRRKT